MTKILQAFVLALKSLTASKMRSFLTMLGIIIGVAAVIVLVSMVNGMSADMMETFESMGTNLVSVTIRGRGGNRAVSVDDMQQLVNDHAEIISAMSPSVTIGGTVKYGNENVSTSCVGVNEYYKDINNSDVQVGRFISYMDVENRLYNCVIGTYLVNELFDGENPIGETVKINGYPFQIVGVLEEKQSSTEGGSDDTVIIPYTVAQKMGGGSPNSYSFSAMDENSVEQVVTTLENYLLGVFSNENAYNVISQSEMVDQVNELTGTMTLVLVGVAGISLLVGGIGIMNIMLVSVTERTREIGIRKSLGATPFDIQSQFVVEAITTSGIGGVIGILFGALAAWATTWMGMTVSISAAAVLISFSVSVIIGVTFGYFPAKKASKLNPIEALRYD